VYILELVAKYQPESEDKALEIIDRIKNRLAHSNHSLVLTTIKCICNMLNCVKSEPELNRIYESFNPPLMSMMNSEYEIQ